MITPGQPHINCYQFLYQCNPNCPKISCRLSIHNNHVIVHPTPPPPPPPPQIRKDSVKNVPTILWLEIQSSFHVWIWHGQSQTLLNRNFPRPTRIQFFFSLLLQFQPTCFTVANRLCPHLTVPNTAVLWAGRLKRTTEFSEKNDTSLFLPDTSVFGLVDTKDCLMPLFIDETVKLRGGQNL